MKSEDNFLPTASFLGLTPAEADRARSQVLILPIPYDGTVTYGVGTRDGPAAILHASTHVELYDREFDAEPALVYGVHTLPPVPPHRGSPEAMVERIAEWVAGLGDELRAGKLLVGLGGEHTVSVGFARGLARVFGTPLLTVQLDAHADLRDAYEGSRYSHACTARRLLELGPVIQLGVRSLSSEEAAFIRAHPLGGIPPSSPSAYEGEPLPSPSPYEGEPLPLASPHEGEGPIPSPPPVRGRAREGVGIRTFFADQVHAGTAHLSELSDLVRDRPVFLTLDLDVFDPGLVPATGTPVPGGLSWQQVVDIVRVVARHARVLGFDCVELAPRAGLHASDFLAAQLVYKAMSLIMMARER